MILDLRKRVKPQETRLEIFTTEYAEFNEYTERKIWVFLCALSNPK